MFFRDNGRNSGVNKPLKSSLHTISNLAPYQTNNKEHSRHGTAYSQQISLEIAEVGKHIRKVCIYLNNIMRQ